MSLALQGCFFSDYTSSKIDSPTKNYKIIATVNRTNKNLDNYADVIIHIFNKNNKKLIKLNSGAGDFSKWAIGWTKTGDTILLQSSDIGNKAWTIKKQQVIEVEMTDKLYQRADSLK